MILFLYFTIFILLILIILLFFRLRLWKSAALSLKKKHSSLAVKHGNTWEQFIPFASNFPYPSEKFIFLGKPIDGIIFNDDEIILMEFKTGNSALSSKQKQIKSLVETNKVRWEEIRY